MDATEEEKKVVRMECKCRWQNAVEMLGKREEVGECDDDGVERGQQHGCYREGERGRAGRARPVGWRGWGDGVPSGRSGRAASTVAPRGGCALPFPVCERFLSLGINRDLLDFIPVNIMF